MRASARLKNISSVLTPAISPLWGATILVFIVSFIFFAYFFTQIPLIHDGDSYYHLAVARIYAQQGFIIHIAAQLPAFTIRPGSGSTISRPPPIINCLICLQVIILGASYHERRYTHITGD